MKQTQISSSLIVLVVLVLHVILGWLLANVSFERLEVEDPLENLQMVDIKLDLANAIDIAEGLDSAGAMGSASTEEAMEAQSNIEPVPSPKVPQPISKPQEFKSTQVTTAADMARKPDPIKPEPPKPEPPKPQTSANDKKIDIKEPVTKPVDNNQTAHTKTTTQNTSHSNSGQQSGTSGTNSKGSLSTGQSGSDKGGSYSQSSSNGATGSGGNKSSGGSSSQANSVTKASLGAGYGSAMTGTCSDFSDESDDEGWVKLKVSINEQGKAQNVQILSSSGIKRLDNQAKRIAINHTYSPAKLNGKAVADDVVFTMGFKCGNTA